MYLSSTVLAETAFDTPLHADPFAQDLVTCLSQHPRQLSPKWFYDETGSRLFEQICELPEYYPTRTELGLLERHGAEMAACIGAGVDLIEFGAGATRKVGLLLQHLPDARRFMPIDISGEHLVASQAPLRARFPSLTIEPLAADFTAPLALPPAVGRRVGFFPGSSIGNFEPAQALALLRRMAGWLTGGGLLVGIDLVKEPAVLHAAYNDAAGVTAAFNRNVLARANRELGCDFDLDGFAHAAFYHPVLQRIEMHLVSRRRQTVRLGRTSFSFEDGESVHTENSYKYTVESFQALARNAGWKPQAVWCDDERRFSVHWLRAASPLH